MFPKLGLSVTEFQNLDKDNNGYITMKELLLYGVYTIEFRKISNLRINKSGTETNLSSPLKSDLTVSNSQTLHRRNTVMNIQTPKK